VAYGAGGTEPTVTDANLVAGRLPSDLALGGRLRLDAGAARDAMSELGARVGLSADECAHGMLEVVDSHMEHALRAVSIEEGADPRQAVLVAFGGAGGLHAGRLARRLGIPTVLIPPLSGVFSALGLLLAPPRVDSARTVMMLGGDTRLAGLAGKLGQEARDRFAAVFSVEPEKVEVGFDCRYEGQSHELDVVARPHWDEIRRVFESSHQQHFGFTRPGEPFEVVTIRSVAMGRPPLGWTDVSGSPPGSDPVGRGGVWQRATLPAGFELIGPTAVVEESSAVVVEAGQRLVVLDDGSLEITEA
jgi:N-methylhydantoinase A